MGEGLLVTCTFWLLVDTGYLTLASSRTVPRSGSSSFNINLEGPGTLPYLTKYYHHIIIESCSCSCSCTVLTP
jgi:hypothetical protein